MRICIEREHEKSYLEVPDEMILMLIKKLSSFCVLSDDMTDETKQNIRSVRVLLKSALVVAGDKLRAALGIEDKPTKKDDLIDWYIASVADKVVTQSKHSVIGIKVTDHDDMEYVTQVYTFSV